MSGIQFKENSMQSELEGQSRKDDLPGAVCDARGTGRMLKAKTAYP